MGNVISRRRALVAFCSFVGKCHTHMHTLVGPDLGSVMFPMYEQCSEHRDRHAFYPWSGALSPLCSNIPKRENQSLRKELHGCFQHTLLGDLGIQLPWMAPKDTDHFPHHLLPRLNDRFQNSVLPSIFLSIFVYSFIKIVSVQYAQTCHLCIIYDCTSDRIIETRLH